MKVDLEARNLEQKGEAEKVGEKLDGQSFTVIRQAAESGQLYGSVSPRDIVSLVTEQGFKVNRSQIALNTPIKTIGLFKVPVVAAPRGRGQHQRDGRPQRRRGGAHRPRRGRHVACATRTKSSGRRRWRRPRRSSSRRPPSAARPRKTREQAGRAAKKPERATLRTRKKRELRREPAAVQAAPRP